jgi:nicotinamidase-related amidase
MTSPFYVPVDLGHTALLLSDVQTDILKRFPADVQEAYLNKIKALLASFRGEITKRRTPEFQASKNSIFEEVPFIIHHTLPFNLNSNAFISPYNKLAKWVKTLEAKGFFAHAPSDPHHPNLSIPAELAPPGGWGGKDEIALAKIQPNCFATSDLLSYLKAREIRHVVLVGLTTRGSILGSARGGADLDFHIIAPREGIIEDVGEEDVDEFLMTKVLPKFIDVVHLDDILNLK